MREKEPVFEVFYSGEWHRVERIRREIKIDERCSLPPYLHLDDGREIHPERAEAIRQVKGDRKFPEEYQSRKEGPRTNEEEKQKLTELLRPIPIDLFRA